MYKFSDNSKEQLKTCHLDIIRLFTEVIKHRDFSVICGHRGEEAQNKAFKNGFSDCPYPKSKHNSLPSMGIDVAPYPIDWEDENAFYELAGFIQATAIQLDIKISWGGGFSSIRDLPHWEINH